MTDFKLLGLIVTAAVFMSGVAFADNYKNFHSSYSSLEAVTIADSSQNFQTAGVYFVPEYSGPDYSFKPDTPPCTSYRKDCQIETTCASNAAHLYLVDDGCGGQCNVCLTCSDVSCNTSEKCVNGECVAKNCTEDASLCKGSTPICDTSTKTCRKKECKDVSCGSSQICDTQNISCRDRTCPTEMSCESGVTACKDGVCVNDKCPTNKVHNCDTTNNIASACETIASGKNCCICTAKNCVNTENFCGNRKCNVETATCVDKTCTDDASICNNNQKCVDSSCVAKVCTDYNSNYKTAIPTGQKCDTVTAATVGGLACFTNCSTKTCSDYNSGYKTEIPSGQTCTTVASSEVGGLTCYKDCKAEEKCKTLDYFKKINSNVFAMPTTFDELQTAVNNVPANGIIVINNEIMFGKFPYTNPKTLTSASGNVIQLAGPGYIDASCPGVDGNGNGKLKSYSDEFIVVSMFSIDKMGLYNLNVEFEGRSENAGNTTPPLGTYSTLTLDNVTMDVAVFGTTQMLVMNGKSTSLINVKGKTTIKNSGNSKNRTAIHGQQFNLSSGSTLSLMGFNQAIQAMRASLEDGSTLNFVNQDSTGNSILFYMDKSALLNFNVGDKVIIEYSLDLDYLFSYNSYGTLTEKIQRLCLYNRNMNLGRLFGECSASNIQNPSISLAYGVIPACTNTFEEEPSDCERIWDKTGDNISGGGSGGGSMICDLCEAYLVKASQDCDATTIETMRNCSSRICSFMPNAVYESCREFDDIYAEMAIDMLLQGYYPQEVCQRLALCR